MVSGSSPVVAHMMALEAYMVVNFRARGISRGARKLARTPTLNKKKKIMMMTINLCISQYYSE
jgi:aryl carrier-like protein